MRIRRDEEEAGEEEIMITPLVDVVFLLLIFFLVTASLKKPTREWDIDLPADTYATAGKFRKNEVIITFMPDGTMHVADKVGGTREKAGMTELRKVLEQAAQQVPRPHVRLDADRNVKLGTVAEVVDILRNYELRDISFRAKDR